MDGWWTDLSVLNQAFYVLAAFFSAFFVWQLLAALFGLGGSDAGIDGDADLGDAGPELNDGPGDGTVAAFKLLSIRSLIAFGMLFGWAGALYLERGLDVRTAVFYAFVWGSAGMGVVAYFFHNVRKLTETGNANLDTCVGTSGEVYLDIPQCGNGQVRVMESGAVAYVSARGKKRDVHLRKNTGQGSSRGGYDNAGGRAAVVLTAVWLRRRYSTFSLFLCLLWRFALHRKIQQADTVEKTFETGRKGRPEGHFFRSRPVT